jgi:hypothetical protein
VVPFSEIKLIVEMELIRRTAGGNELSREMTELLALVVFDDYELFPARDHSQRVQKV